MQATLFYRDGRKESVTGMAGEIFDTATLRGAYRIETADGSVARWFGGDWVWVR